jgi:hypothetical protein
VKESTHDFPGTEHTLLPKSPENLIADTELNKIKQDLTTSKIFSSSEDEDEDDENILEQDNTKSKKDLPVWKQKTQKVLDSWPISGFMTFITVYALFFDDIRILCIPIFLDDLFYSITLLCLVCFGIEIVFACMSKPGYLFSFFFWLDLISTVSLITDIGWIMKVILSGATGLLSIAKMSRAGRIT